MARQINTNHLGFGDYGSNFSLCFGVVKDNADPAQHGRVKIYIPSTDSIDFDVEDLPWAIYVSPFGGTTANFLVGREQDELPGATTYGFWAIPKNGAQVLCGYLEGDPNLRFYLGCFYMPELNRTLPQSVNDIKTEIDESGQYPQAEIPHYRENLDEAGLAPGDDHYKTRGGWERSVSYPKNKVRAEEKPDDDGYYPKPLEPDKKDSQTYCWTTPGRHFISMQDVDEFCRMRLKTTAGSQIILDDTNERIYISTARGRNWVELDEGSGKIYFYTASKLNFHSENDMNFYTEGNLNLVAKKRVNIQSEDRAVKIQSKLNTEILSSAGNVKLTASRDLHLKTLDGQRGDAVSARQSCSKPPYDGDALGLIRDFAEEAGAGTSKIYVNAVEGIEIRSERAEIRGTAKTTMDLRALDGDLTLQAGKSINFKATSWLTSLSGDTDLQALDIHGNENALLKVAPKNNFRGSAASAAPGAAVSGDGIKSKMVVPEHESWERDEDEGSCSTPRNDSYQG